MGLMPVPPGHVATIVTSLEMSARPRAAPMPDSRLRLVQWARPAPDKYRALFRRIGAPWLWYSRLVMAQGDLIGHIHHDDVAIFAACDARGVEVGFLELDWRHPGECQLQHFGFVPGLVGKGHGRWLMAHALLRAWRPGVKLVCVHTCTLDHPRALDFYRKAGFTAYQRTIETFPDPRLSGVLPRDIAPHIPLLDPATRR